jgi:de-etiolated-1
MKHRLLTFLYRKAHAATTDPQNPDVSALARFHRFYEHFLRLKMWKMQLLDEDTLLLKFASEDVVTKRIEKPDSEHSLFVTYHIVTTEILAVFENTTEAVVDMFSNYVDFLRNNNLTLNARCSATSSNNAVTM